MPEQLKPCPFCGEKAEFERIGNRRQSTIIACQGCGAIHESSDVECDAGRSWNCRTSETVEKNNISDKTVVVPVTPTPAMIARMVEVWNDIAEDSKVSDTAAMECVWDAALAAAKEG